ncbi:MAG TPA: hypothetical protein VGE16_00745 [Albitalea sp.]
MALGIVAGALAYGWMRDAPPAVDAASAASAAGTTLASAAPVERDAPSVATLPAPAASAPRPVAAATPASPPAAATPRIPRVRDPNGDQTPDISDYINEGEVPTMKEVIDRLHQAGVHTGLGAFQPPGTRPPLVGLAVPEDFVLPEGYVRHYQATDDGQRIEPILMFSPDHLLVDAAGRPIAVPENRVVPPELAPPGLPIRRIVIPAPTEPGRR